MSIVGIILAMTMNLGWQYFQELQYRQDKESFIGLVDELLTMARTSSYYHGERFEVLDITLTTGSLMGTIWSTTLATFWTGTLIDTYTLQEWTIVFANDALQLRLYPYTIWCDLILGDTWFSIVGSVTQEETCFEVFTDVCKIKQITCP